MTFEALESIQHGVSRAMAGVALACSFTLAADTTWIDLDARRPADSLATTSVQGWIPKVVGGFADSGTHILPDTNGMRVDGFRQPRGSWHMFARIRPDAYGSQDSWYLGNLASTSSWPNYGNGYSGKIQGLDVRLGGGRFYPQSRRDPRVSDAEWQASLDYFDHDRNAAVSRCILSFAVATTHPVVNWKEVYSNRCVQAGVWHDLSIGWNGTRISMYLDGVDVADTNRFIGAGLPLSMDSITTLFVGIRGDATYDKRHFHGAIQSLAFHSGPLDSALALRLHQQTNGLVSGSCRAVPEVVEPRTLSLVAPTEKIILRLQPATDCQPGLVPDLVLRPGDSLDILAISLDESQRRLGGARIGSLETTLAALGMRSDSATPFRLKARLVRAVQPTPFAARSASLEEAPWNDDRPMVLVGNTSGVRRPSAAPSSVRLVQTDRILFPGAKTLVAARMDGARVQIPVVDPASGLFDISRLSSGVWVLRDGSRRFLLARP